MGNEIPWHSSGEDQSGDELEEALSEALGTDSRAEELRQMQRLLRERRVRMAHELDVSDDAEEQKKLRHAIAKLDEQIRVLSEEAGITQFVEDSVRLGVEMRKLQN